MFIKRNMTAKKKKYRLVNTKHVKFYNETYLSKRLGIDRRKFHREIKPIIVADFPEICKELESDNPDIGLDSSNILYLSNIEHTIVKSTGLSIFDYI